MSDESPRHHKNEQKSLSKDIAPVLKGWDYEPGTINVRKINGTGRIAQSSRCASTSACCRWK